jgi:Fe-S cluster assembly ATP-binding protein
LTASVLKISGLHAGVDSRQILRGIDLEVRSGEIHAVMGPNGSGKSTLAHVLMGRPGYEVTRGSVTLDGVELLGLAPFERARAGLFLTFQYPIEVPGVPLASALTESLVAAGRVAEAEAGPLRARLSEEAAELGISPEILARPMNVDLSGGEAKRNETLQLAILRPRIAILDELDSGLDVDALGQVARRIERATREGDPPLGVIAITHYRRLLAELPAQRVHVLSEGRIVASGGPELAEELERTGYAAYREDAGAPGGAGLGDARLGELGLGDTFPGGL